MPIYMIAADIYYKRRFSKRKNLAKELSPLLAEQAVLAILVEAPTSHNRCARGSEDEATEQPQTPNRPQKRNTSWSKRESDFDQRQEQQVLSEVIEITTSLSGVLIPASSALVGGWITAKLGRKVRFRIGDVEVEASSEAEAKRLLEYALEIKRSSGGGS